MTNHAQKRRSYVFQVTRNEVVRTEIIKATSQEEAEKILSESDPTCSYKFLWIKKRSTTVEEEPKHGLLTVLLILGVLLLVAALLLWIFHIKYFLYLLFSGLGVLLIASVYEWRRNL